MANSQPRGLDSIPVELLEAICDNLGPEGLAVLSRVNKYLHGFTAPLLWSAIELHSPRFHEACLFGDEFDLDGAKKDCWKRRHFKDNYAAERASRAFLELFEPGLKPQSDKSDTTPEIVIPSARLDELALSVRSLCIDFKIPAIEDSHDEETEQEPWSLFAKFQNLEYLEVTGHWGKWDNQLESYKDKLATYTMPVLTKLRTLKLTGYLPRDFAIWAVRGSVWRIEDLTLALLDRPIGSSNSYERQNPPPEKPEPGGRIMGAHDYDELAEWDSEEAEEFEDAETIAPRALAAIQGSGLIAKFESLKKLTLRRPCQSSQDTGDDDWMEQYISSGSESLILNEWYHLIRGSTPTLEHLILDQRPVAENNEQDSTGASDYLACYPYGPGYDRFMDEVWEELMMVEGQSPERSQWLKLKSIRVYGFDVPPETHDPLNDFYRPTRVKHEKTFLYALEQRFKPLGVDIKSGLGRRMLYDEENGEINFTDYTDGFGGYFDPWDGAEGRP